MRLPLVADDRFHGYTLSLSKHVEWTGEINRLRLDPTDKKAAVTIRSFQIVDRIGPIIQPVFFYPNSPCTKVGNPIQLKARFRNEGDEEGKVFLQLKGLSNNLKIDNPAGIWLTVEAGKERDAVWIVSASNDCAEVVTCAWEAPESAKSGTTSGSMQSIVQVVDTQQVLDRGVLSEGDYRLTFCRTDLGYGPMLFSLKKRDTFETVALMPRLGTVKIQHDDNSVGLYPLFYKQAQSGWNSENGAERFAVDWRDRDGRLWEFSLTIQKSKTIQGVFLFCHSLKSDGGKLLHFSGPELYIGEGTFGQAKDMAVFPGIEYLDRDAISSSDAVAHPPVRDQYIPHPYKNTIPFMSLTHDEMMVSLLWPANAKWVDGHNGLSPVFAVPNRFHGQNNHLFSLVVPPVPDSRMENQDTAFEPFLMSKGEPIQILSAVQLAHSNDPNDALETWLKLFAEDRLPEPMPAPRSYAESIHAGMRKQWGGDIVPDGKPIHREECWLCWIWMRF